MQCRSRSSNSLQIDFVESVVALCRSFGSRTTTSSSERFIATSMLVTERSAGRWTSATRARSQSRCRPSTRPTRPQRTQLSGEAVFLLAHWRFSKLLLSFMTLVLRGGSLHSSVYATSCDPALTVSISMGPCVTRLAWAKFND